MKKKYIYLIIGLLFLLLIGITICVSLKINYGLYVNLKYDNPLEITYSIFKMVVSFIFLLVSILFFIKEKEHNKNSLLLIYFLFTFIADIFFTIFDISLGGFIFFIIAYILMAIYLYKHYREIIIRAILYIIPFILMFIFHKESLSNSVLILLATLLLLNMIYSWVNYIKNKEKKNLYLSIGTTLCLISDLCIGIRGAFKDPKIIGDITSLVVWPTYILANLFILYVYYLNKQDNKDLK